MSRLPRARVGQGGWTRSALLLAALLSLPAGVAAQAEARIAVATRDIPRGAVLQSTDIAYRPAAAGATATGGAIRAEASAGWVTRRVIAEGEPLREPAVAPPPVIRVGDAVQVIWSEGSMELRLAGRAMNSALAGERVTVRVDLERRFEGVAVGAGLVRLDSLSRSR